MVIDANTRDVARGELTHRGLRRDEVIGTALAKQAFEVIDAIWLQDGRLAEIQAAG
jgi:hypothetical protein